MGIASYRNPDKLRATIASIEQMSRTDYRCFIVHNPSEDDAETRAVIRQACNSNSRFVALFMSQNEGYAGAVNEIVKHVKTPYFVYCDNDVEIQTSGWDERMCRMMDEHDEIGQVFPGAGHYGFHNGKYHECLWNAGYCWAMRKSAVPHRMGYPGDALMDSSLGHHEEVDLMIRLRLAGYRIACDPAVSVLHHASATSSPESAKRIHMGVVRWMNKWNRYFCGEALKYPNPDPDKGEGYDPRCLRYTDWPPCALYLERMTLAMFPMWNAMPRAVMVPGVGEMDAVEILKPKGCYVGRAI